MHVRSLVRQTRIAFLAARYLVTCRNALPRWLRALLAVAMVCTLLPAVPDFGLDEGIYALGAALLWWRHRPLLRVCLRAATLEADGTAYRLPGSVA